MTVLESLVLAHVAGDWLLQTEWQATRKAHDWRALATHVAVYHLLVLGVLAARFGLAEWKVWAVVVGLAAAHAFLDLGWPVRSLMRAMRLVVERGHERWLVLGVDQSLHLLMLGAAAWVLTEG